MKFWGKFKKNFWFFLVLAAVLVHLAISLKLALYWYNHFNLGKYDLGNVTQVVYNTLHGKFFTYTDRFGTQISRLSDHADFILLLFVPVFAVFPSSLVFVVAQCLALSSGGIIIFLLSRKLGLPKLAATLLSLAYLFNPEIGSLTLDAFHGITFAIPFLLLSFYFFERYTETRCRRDLWGLLIASFLVLISKEEVSLLIAFFGLYMFFFRKEKRLGIYYLTAGGFWFILYFFVISPAFGPQREASVANFARDFPDLVPKGATVLRFVRVNPFLSRYSHLGSSYKDLLLSPFQRSSVFWQEVLDGDYLYRLFAPFGFLGILAPAVLLIGIPEYLINTLATGETMTGFFPGTLHHISLLLPVVAYATIWGLHHLGGRFGRYLEFDPTLPSAILVALCALFTGFRSENPVLSNPMSLASRRVLPVVQTVARKYGNSLRVSFDFRGLLGKPKVRKLAEGFF